MFYKSIYKRMKKTAITCVMATALTLTTVCTTGFETGGYEPVKAESVVTQDGFETADGVLKKYNGNASEVVVPENVTELGDYVFSGCRNVTKIILPKGVKKIGEGAFWDCENLKEINLPVGLTELGESTFADCEKMEKIKFCANFHKVELGAYSFQNTAWLKAKKKKNPMVCVQGVFIDGKACKGEVVIPSSVKYISPFCFSGSKITGVKVPGSVNKMEGYAFYGCKNLKKVTLPKNLKIIEEGLFLECRNLKKITLPESLTKIGELAFSECRNLTQITIPESVTKISENAFENTPLKEIKGYSDTEAQRFAVKTGVPFVALDAVEEKTLKREVKVLVFEINPKISLRDSCAVVSVSGEDVFTYENGKIIGKKKGTGSITVRYDGRVTAIKVVVTG